MAILNYDEDTKIDPDALDVEWLRQADMAHRYIKHCVKARKAERLADERVKVIRSELIKKATEDPESTTGKPKPTAADVEAFYRAHPDHQAAKQEWIEAASEAEYAEMAQKEISWGRKATLENLVTLHGASYFAGPSAPRNISREWERRQKQSSSNAVVAAAIKRNK